jgi:hypothetical protein
MSVFLKPVDIDYDINQINFDRTARITLKSELPDKKVFVLSGFNGVTIACPSSTASSFPQNYTLRKIKLALTNTYGYGFLMPSTYCRVDSYPLIWIWFEFLGLLDHIWDNVCKFTYFFFRYLNKGFDYVPANEFVPKNPLKIAYLFGINGCQKTRR